MVDFISCFLFTLLRIFISNIGKFQFIVVPLFFAFFKSLGVLQFLVSHTQHRFFAAMLQNKLYVFCCPFFRTLTEFCIVSKGESGGSLRRKKKKKGKQKKIHDNVVGRRQPIDDLLQVKTNFCCRTVR